MKFIRLLKKITAIITLYTLPKNKLRIAPVALVDRSLSHWSCYSLRTCRACRARRDLLCRACCTARATQHVQLFPIPKCMG